MHRNHSILFWVNKSRRSQKTLKAPIYVRITVNGKRAEFSTGKSIPIDKWIPTAGRSKGNSEEARALNRYLDNINVKLTRIIDKTEDEGEAISASEVKSRFIGRSSNRHSLIDLFESHNLQIKCQIGNGYSAGTLERYETSLKHLKSYLSKVYETDDIFCEDMNYSFIADFEFFLKSVKKIGHNTTVKYLRNFKKIVLLALKNEWIDRDPFIRFKLTLKDVNKEYLTQKELQQLIVKNFSIGRLGQVRDIFVFCCHTGLSYADVQRLSKEDIQTGLDGELWIMVNRKKTGIQSHIPLLPAAKKLIDKYENDPESNYNDKLLPVVSNQKINAYLKEIGDLCGITKNITFHMARHTFATTITLSNGVSMETVSSMLGHKNIRTTQIYAKVVKEKVSQEMNELKFKLDNNHDLKK